MSIARKQDGATLMELVVVLAVIGTLVLLAVVYYRVLVRRARSMEAYLHLSNLYVNEVVYKAEHETFRAAGVHPRPDDLLDAGKFPWGNSNPDFIALGFDPQGSVYFNYRVLPVTDIRGDFKAVAKSDLDNDDKLAIYSVRSGDRQVVKENDEY